MKIISASILVAIFFAGCISSSNKIMNKFQGMWKLDKYESYDTGDEKWYNYLPELVKQATFSMMVLGIWVFNCFHHHSKKLQITKILTV
jgi:hypothetical protein